ncbi:MAG: iron-containing alcohol dehydrogenase [Candidatus Cloacimonetes bacterium]|jgi:alcohol dehydrogenase|nr:iron-containing alcohol dehydrogenase [Candidatus Cloacimonadota bacterium]MDD2507182.1 iron-containing alcohol dehydrogenase [Candidatus Cloacimonadota bacterium]MDD4559826.1 iron-containing alcohol dehydrogenase [Candidatus Cloacimonadota bacterium]
MLYLPTRICFGADALNEAGAYLPSMGKKALIVCGKSSAVKSGVMSDLLPLLDSKGIAHSVFAEISENPDTTQIIAGKGQLIKEACDFVIGIGGGSPLDAAKAISLAAANDLLIDQLYDAEMHQNAYPIVAIPTTHGTGSETTQYSVLTDKSSHKKAGFGCELLFPRLAIVDPKYTLSLSPRISLNTSIDALSHLLEGIYSSMRNPLLYPMIFRGISLIKDNLQTCLKNPGYLPARNALCLASMYGGITIAHTSTTLQHAIGYPFTTEYNTPHGLANGMFIEIIMRYYYPAVKAELDQLFASLGMTMEGFLEWLDAFPIKLKVDADDALLYSWTDQILAARNTVISPVIPDKADLMSLLKSVQKERV